MISHPEIQRIIRLAERHKRSASDNVIQNALKNPERILSREGIGKIVYERYQEVSKESARLKSFTRLKVYPERLLVGRINEEHDVGGLVLSYFMNKFPTFFIIIFSNHCLHCGSKKIKVNIEPFGSSDEEIIDKIRKTILKRMESMGLKLIETKNFKEDSWEAYYDSQYIPEKKNLTAQNNKCLPAKERVYEMKHYLRKKENKSLRDL